MRTPINLNRSLIGIIYDCVVYLIEDEDVDSSARSKSKEYQMQILFANWDE